MLSSETRHCIFVRLNFSIWQKFLQSFVVVIKGMRGAPEFFF